MTRRQNQSPEARERERLANRARMAEKRAAMTEEERREEAARRKERERVKAARDPEWAAMRQARRSATLRRYIQSRRDDPDFWAKRNEYLRRWREERRIDEEFADFMARIEVEATT